MKKENSALRYAYQMEETPETLDDVKRKELKID